MVAGERATTDGVTDWVPGCVDCVPDARWGSLPLCDGLGSLGMQAPSSVAGLLMHCFWRGQAAGPHACIVFGRSCCGRHAAALQQHTGSLNIAGSWPLLAQAGQPPSKLACYDITRSEPSRVACSRCLASSTRQWTCVGSCRLLRFLQLPRCLAAAFAAPFRWVVRWPCVCTQLTAGRVGSATQE